MKTFFIAAIGGLILFTSCSTYRGAQTPDDMYYSASPKVATGRGAANDDYVQANSSRNDGRYDQSSYNGYDDYATSDDRWLMMRVRDRSRWSVFDDYNYYNPYNDFAYGGMGGYGMGYGMGYGYGSGFGLGYGSGFYSPYYSFGLGLGYGGFGYGYFNNYYNWNSIYNPYYYNSIAVNPKLNPAGYTTVRNFNLGGYNNRNYNATNPSRGAVRPNYNGYVNPSTSPSRVYNNRQYYNGNSGGTNRRVYSNNSTINGSNNNQSYDRPVRAYTPSNNSSYTPAPRSSGYSGGSSGYSGGGGGGSSSGGGGSRPARR